MSRRSPVYGRLVGVTLALCLTASASRARAEDEAGATAAVPEAEAEPVRYPPSSVRWPLILGGIGFTAVAYGATAGVGAAWPDAPGASSLAIPVVGPWVALARNGCPPGEADCGAAPYARGTLEIVSGLAQLGGLLIAVEGILATTEATKAEPESGRLVVVPTLGPSLVGVALGGAF